MVENDDINSVIADANFKMNHGYQSHCLKLTFINMEDEVPAKDLI